MEIDTIFKEGGLISAHHPDYEYRPQQERMANAVKAVLDEGKHLIVEAGTGIGKSFAYLVPAIYHSVQMKKRVIISTYTISLQEQLMLKDVPFLKEILPFQFNIALVKGRSNYISLRRLRQALTHQGDLFEDQHQLEQLEYILKWSKTTEDGSLSDMEHQPSAKIWDTVSSDHDNCMGRRCPYFKECFFYRARHQMEKADILVVNHHIFFTHLALNETGHPLLPEYGAVIFDEAHNIENVATEYLGLQITNSGVKYLLDRLYNPKRQKGFLLRLNDERLIKATSMAHEAGKIFFKQIEEWMRASKENAKRIRVPNIVENILNPCLKEIAILLKDNLKHSKNKEEELEIKSYIKKVTNLERSIDIVVEQQLKDYVYWVEYQSNRRMRIAIHGSPIDVSTLLKQMLFSQGPTVIMTSATLSTRGSPDRRQASFDFFKNRVGMDDAVELMLDSPYEYKKQVRLYIARDMPDPACDNEAYIGALIKKIEYYLSISDGGSFVLFTNYKTMDEVYSALADSLKEKGIRSFKQGDGLSRCIMLAEFRKDAHSVLFGADSFWQGVDVAGEALSCVIITKLPFSVPDHPIVEARIERVQEKGMDPFLEYSLPEAVLKLKQGFGRLIRHREDRGIVVILDSRILSRFYGRHFLQALPECDVVVQ